MFFVNPNKFPNLIELNLGYNGQLEKLDLSGLKELKILMLAECGIRDVRLSEFPDSLNGLDLSNNIDLRSVDLSSLKNLKNKT